jgi:hypothetical protein
MSARCCAPNLPPRLSLLETRKGDHLRAFADLTIISIAGGLSGYSSKRASERRRRIVTTSFLFHKKTTSPNGARVTSGSSSRLPVSFMSTGAGNIPSLGKLRLPREKSGIITTYLPA